MVAGATICKPTGKLSAAPLQCCTDRSARSPTEARRVVCLSVCSTTAVAAVSSSRQSSAHSESAASAAYLRSLGEDASA